MRAKKVPTISTPRNGFGDGGLDVCTTAWTTWTALQAHSGTLEKSRAYSSVSSREAEVTMIGYSGLTTNAARGVGGAMKLLGGAKS